LPILQHSKENREKLYCQSAAIIHKFPNINTFTVKRIIVKEEREKEISENAEGLIISGKGIALKNKKAFIVKS